MFRTPAVALVLLIIFSIACISVVDAHGSMSKMTFQGREYSVREGVARNRIDGPCAPQTTAKTPKECEAPFSGAACPSCVMEQSAQNFGRSAGSKPWQWWTRNVAAHWNEPRAQPFRPCMSKLPYGASGVHKIMRGAIFDAETFMLVDHSGLYRFELASGKNATNKDFFANPISPWFAMRSSVEVNPPIRKDRAVGWTRKETDAYFAKTTCTGAGCSNVMNPRRKRLPAHCLPSDNCFVHDKITIPKDTPLGPATLRWMWNAAQTPQAYANCVDLEIIDEGKKLDPICRANRDVCTDRGRDCCAHKDWREPQTCARGWRAVRTGSCVGKAGAKYKCCQIGSRSPATPAPTPSPVALVPGKTAICPAGYEVTSASYYESAVKGSAKCRDADAFCSKNNCGPPAALMTWYLGNTKCCAKPGAEPTPPTPTAAPVIDKTTICPPGYKVTDQSYTTKSKNTHTCKTAEKNCGSGQWKCGEAAALQAWYLGNTKCCAKPAEEDREAVAIVSGGSSAEASAQPVKNAGVDCWGGCGAKQGACAFCGTGYCCRKGWHDKSNGCDGNMGISGKGHVCVKAPVKNAGVDEPMALTPTAAPVIKTTICPPGYEVTDQSYVVKSKNTHTCKAAEKNCGSGQWKCGEAAALQAWYLGNTKCCAKPAATVATADLLALLA